MIKTKHYDRLEAALDCLCRDYNLAFPIKLFGMVNYRVANDIIETFKGMELIEDNTILVKGEPESYDIYHQWTNSKMKYTKKQVVETILPIFFKAIEWWNSNTGKYNQQITEKYYPNKKWSSLSERKVYEIYLSEGKPEN